MIRISTALFIKDQCFVGEYSGSPPEVGDTVLLKPTVGETNRYQVKDRVLNVMGRRVPAGDMQIRWDVFLVEVAE